MKERAMSYPTSEVTLTSSKSESNVVLNRLKYVTIHLEGREIATTLSNALFVRSEWAFRHNKSIEIKPLF